MVAATISSLDESLTSAASVTSIGATAGVNNNYGRHNSQVRPLSPLVRELKILSWIGGFPLSICDEDTVASNFEAGEAKADYCARNQFGRIKHNIFSQVLAMSVLLAPGVAFIAIYFRKCLDWTVVYGVFRENGFTFWDTFGIILCNLLAMLVQWPEIIFLAKMGPDLNKLSNKMASLCASFGHDGNPIHFLVVVVCVLRLRRIAH